MSIPIKEIRFLENYLQTFDLAGSYRAAGFGDGGSSDIAKAQQLIEKHRDRLKLMSRRNADNQVVVDAGRTLSEVSAIAFSNIGSVMNWTERGVTLQPLSDLPVEVTAAIRKIILKPGEFGTEIGVEMHDKKAMLAMLMKHFNLDCNLNELIARVRAYGYEVIDVREVKDKIESR